MTLPRDAKPLRVANSTVDFYEFEQEGITYYYFDTSECTPPHPMINAMAGLQLLTDDSKRLIMLNHTPPSGLFPKIDANYEFDLDETSDGKIEVIFKFKTGTQNVTDFNDNQCSG